MQKILDLPETFVKVLTELSPEHLRVLEQFAQFLYQQDQQGQPITIQTSAAPAVAEPRNLLYNLIGVMEFGYDGDALKDSESLYDEA